MLITYNPLHLWQKLQSAGTLLQLQNPQITLGLLEKEHRLQHLQQMHKRVQAIPFIPPLKRWKNEQKICFLYNVIAKLHSIIEICPDQSLH